MKKIICFFLIGALSMLGVLLVISDRVHTAQETDKIRQLKQEAESYEEEIRQLENERSARKSQLTESDGIPSVIIGFVPANIEDFDKIRQLTVDYDLTSVIILDCSLDSSTLERIAERAEEENYEIILAGITFDEEVLEKADSIRSELNPDGNDSEGEGPDGSDSDGNDPDGNSGNENVQASVFLLREKDDTAENRELLCGHHYSRFILYSSSCESGSLERSTSEDGGAEGEIANSETPENEYLSYGFLNNQAPLSSITGRMQDNSNRVLAIFNLQEIYEGTLTEETITADLLQLDQMLEQGTIQSPALSTCYQELQEEITRQQEKQAEYDAFCEETQAKIQELQSAVNAIYGTWE